MDPIPPPTAKDRTFVTACSLVVGIAIVYLSFLTKQYYWDGIAFAQAIEDAAGLDRSLIHPSHLIYNAVGYVFYRVVRALGANIRAVTALQILNSLLSAFAAGTLFLILRKTVRSLYLSISLTLLFAFSSTWWKFSTDADAYIASVFFILIAFYLILPGNKPRPFVTAAMFLLSIVFHELAIFFGVVLAIGLIQQTEGKHERVIAALKFVTFTALLTLLIYGACFYFASGKVSLLGFLRWVTYHSPDGDFSFSLAENIKYTLRGHVRLFFGGRFNLLNGLVNPIILGLIVIGTVAALAFLYFAARKLGKVRSAWPLRREWDSNHRKLLRLVLVWLTLYELFLFFWIPQNTFYRLFYLPALILLIGLFAVSARNGLQRKRTYTLASFVAMLTLANFLFQIFPYSHVEKYSPLKFAIQMNREWPSGTTIFFAADNSDENLMRYFNPGTQWKKIDMTQTNLLDEELKAANERAVTTWLETTAIDNLESTPSGKQWLSEHSAKDVFAVNDSAYRIRFIQVLPGK